VHTIHDTPISTVHTYFNSAHLFQQCTPISTVHTIHDTHIYVASSGLLLLLLVSNKKASLLFQEQLVC
jgi:hypothetical protein